MSIEVVPLDTSTPEGAARTIAGLHATQRDLAQRSEDLRANLDQKVIDLTTSMRTLRESFAFQERATIANGPDSELGFYSVRGASDNRDVQRSGVIGVGDLDRVRDAGDRVPYVSGADGSAVRLYGTTGRTGFRFGLIDDPSPRSPWQRDLQGLVTQRALVRAWGCRRTPICDALLLEHLERAPGSLRILSDVASAGAEWIPDNMLPQLEQELRLARRTEALFDVVSMPSGTMVIPFLSTDVQPYLTGVGTTDDPPKYKASTPTTAQRTITARSIAGRIVIDRDAEEDALISLAATGMSALVNGMVSATEDLIYNGDTAATHQDAIASWNPRSYWPGDLGGTNDHRRGWVGLRARAADVSATSDGSGAATFAGAMAQFAAMDVPYGLSDSYLAMSPEYYLSTALLWAEVVSVDKFGDAATIKSGVLGKAGVANIIVSEFLTPDLNASGVYDGVTESYAANVAFNRSRFKMGVRRQMRVESETKIENGVITHVATERKIFFTGDSSTRKNVHVAYKMPTS